jgi:HEAT repeat protein
MLEGTDDDGKLITLLKPFLKFGDPQIASKCVLVIGRHARNMDWLNGVMRDHDDRVRANLIESLWNRREPEVLTVLTNALADPHPRVAANAVRGLYLLGSEERIKGLERLTSHEDAAFRKSAIWMMKSSGIPDAPARLQQLIRDADPEVRHAAFRALIYLRESDRKKTSKAAAAVP